MNLKNEEYPRSFLKKYTLAVLKTISKEKFDLENKEIIDSDLVPEIYSDFREIDNLNKKTIFYLQNIEKQMALSERKGPVIERINVGPITKRAASIIKPTLPKGQAFIKIQPLINDNSVQVIECKEENQPIIITRFGRKQPTQIKLSKEEINDILMSFSEEVHIPLINGPFHIHLRNLEVMAIYSEITGSNFIIKKEYGQQNNQN